MTPDPKPLPPAEVGRLLEGAMTMIRAELAALSDEILAWHLKVGLLRVSDLLHEWVHHDRNHLRQIPANVQARAWPHMGTRAASPRNRQVDPRRGSRTGHLTGEGSEWYMSRHPDNEREAS
jgi:hypothetical protein